MAEFNLPAYCNDDIARVNHRDMIDVLKELIDDIMTENRSYYDDEDRLATLEMIYPVVSGIVLNAHFAPVRTDKAKILEITTYPVTHLA